MKTSTLDDIKVGERVVVEELKTVGAMRRRLLDIGLCGGTAVECVGRSPMGDPSAYLIRGAVIAIRACDCRGVIVKTCSHSPKFEHFGLREQVPGVG